MSALQALGLCTEELTAVWAVLASILQLGNICFSSLEVSFRRDAGSVVWLVCIISGNLSVGGHPQGLTAVPESGWISIFFLLI